MGQRIASPTTSAATTLSQGGASSASQAKGDATPAATSNRIAGASKAMPRGRCALRGFEGARRRGGEQKVANHGNAAHGGGK